MRKNAARLLLVLSCATFFTGCATIGHARVTSLVTLNERGPVSAGPATGSSKIGKAQAWGILVYATGDASISAAMANGRITRIHHVDHLTTSMLGIYAKYETIVYGDERSLSTVRLTAAPPD